jgi:tetratricopeptide (TPR) repeat protein
MLNPVHPIMVAMDVATFARRGAATVALVCALAGHALAKPGGQTIAKPIVDDAVAQYNLGHFSEASALFEKAYRIDPAPILLFNIGQCHRRLGNNELALFFYRQYLDQAPPNAQERPDVVKRVADLERSIREQADLKDKPPPGVARDVPTNGPASPPPPGLAEGGPTVALSTPPLNPPPILPAAAAEDPSKRQLRIFAWVTGGFAVAALVLGVAESMAWSTRSDRFNNHTGPTTGDPMGLSKNCGVDEINHGGVGCSALYDDVSTARTLAIVGLAGGAALTAGSLILFFKSTSGQDSGTSTATACVPNLYSPGVLCRLSF